MDDTPLEGAKEELPIIKDILEAETLSEAIHYAVGNASTHWENMEGTSLYQEDQARAVSKALEDYVLAHQPSEKPQANLGLATTNELLEEVRARISMDYLMGGGGLGYTTVDGRPAAWHDNSVGEVGYAEGATLEAAAEPVERDSITNYHYGAQITLNVTNYNQPLD